MKYDIQKYNQNQQAIIRLMVSKGIIKNSSQFVELYASLFHTLYFKNGNVKLNDFTLAIQ